MPRVLLLSAYHARSHDYWCQGLLDNFRDWEWTLLTLPPRHFSWRIRGNGLSWAFGEAERLQQSYDLLIATSMVDLATLRGLVPSLAAVPSLVYFHENQFAYPRTSHQHPSVEAQMVNLYTALAADWIAFNSAHNRETFLAGVDSLLRRLPDAVPAGIRQRLNDRSSVVPVPLSECWYRRTKAPGFQGPLTLVWNHRWEYDKGPERLLAALQRVPASLPLQVHVLGQQFRQQPAVMNELRQFLLQRGSLGQWGYVKDMDEYRAILQGSHAVVSTALHDFQGLAVLQAVAAGCLPLVPARLVYPQWFGAENCYWSGGIDSNSALLDDEAGALATAIQKLGEKQRAGELPPAPDVSRFSWRNHADTYRGLMTNLMVGRQPAPSH